MQTEREFRRFPEDNLQVAAPVGNRICDYVGVEMGIGCSVYRPQCDTLFKRQCDAASCA